MDGTQTQCPEGTFFHIGFCYERGCWRWPFGADEPRYEYACCGPELAAEYRVQAATMAGAVVCGLVLCACCVLLLRFLRTRRRWRRFMPRRHVVAPALDAEARVRVASTTAPRAA